MTTLSLATLLVVKGSCKESQVCFTECSKPSRVSSAVASEDRVCSTTPRQLFLSSKSHVPVVKAVITSTRHDHWLPWPCYRALSIVSSGLTKSSGVSASRLMFLRSLINIFSFLMFTSSPSSSAMASQCLCLRAGFRRAFATVKVLLKDDMSIWRDVKRGRDPRVLVRL